MADVNITDAPTLIAEDDARGAESPEEVSTGDTLMPMLGWGVALVTLGFGAVFIFMR